MPTFLAKFESIHCSQEQGKDASTSSHHCTGGPTQGNKAKKKERKKRKIRIEKESTKQSFAGNDYKHLKSKIYR